MPSACQAARYEPSLWLQVARDSALSFNPSVKITAYHDSIFNPTYNVDFFKQFTLVMNALDNKGT